MMLRFKVKGFGIACPMSACIAGAVIGHSRHVTRDEQRFKAQFCWGAVDPLGCTATAHRSLLRWAATKARRAGWWVQHGFKPPPVRYLPFTKAEADMLDQACRDRQSGRTDNQANNLAYWLSHHIFKDERSPGECRRHLEKVYADLSKVAVGSVK